MAGFDANFRAGQFRSYLGSVGYRQSLLESDLLLPGGRRAAIASFAQQPTDARSACIAAIDENRSASDAANACFEAGFPVTFVRLPDRVEWWRVKEGQPQQFRSILSLEELDKLFARYEKELRPESIYRAKVWARVDTSYQLDFVDVGLLPIVEREVGRKVTRLLEDNVVLLQQRLGWDRIPQGKEEWVLHSVFWLLAARILHDKAVPQFVSVRLTDVKRTLALVTEHCGAKVEDYTLMSHRELEALEAVADSIGGYKQHLGLLTTEALAEIYESAMITKQTRKELGTHSTPTWLVDYVIARLAPWIEHDIPRNERRVFEPACGHAGFLVAALQLLTHLLPPEQATPAKRKDYLRDRMHGGDRDAFALELARLSLTLTDIPNDDHWRLTRGDMFVGDYLEREARQATILLANPPFERFTLDARGDYDDAGVAIRYVYKTTELLSRVLPHLPSKAVFGLVLPQSFLMGNEGAGLRGSLFRDFEIQEVCLFSCKIFRYAHKESVILLGRKLSAGVRATGTTLVRRVDKRELAGFKTKYLSTSEERVKQTALQAGASSGSLVAELGSVWQSVPVSTKLHEIASVGIGILYLGQKHADYPRGEPTHWKTKPSSKGVRAREGFFLLGDEVATHKPPVHFWLNYKGSVAKRYQGAAENLLGHPQVILNYVRISSASPWRVCAFIDEEGLAFKDTFLAVRPQSGDMPVEYLWALLNSPFANAYLFSHCHTMHNKESVLREMPVPSASVAERQNVVKRVRRYLAYAQETDWSNASDSQHQEALVLHLQVDAAVLSLYQLPVKRERQLLDFFTNHRRRRVPFNQVGYFPKHFTDPISLSDYVAIAYDWETVNERRCDLIDKKVDRTLARSEKTEYEHLQHLADLKHALIGPLPTGKLDKLDAELQRRGL